MKPTLSEPEIVVRGGKPAAVILDIDAYEEILERLEDAHDLKTLRKMRRALMRFRGLDDFLKAHAARV